MTQQQQIALLAAALQEVGKMPTDWLVTHGGRALIYQELRYNFDMVIDAEPAALAALCGVAAEFIAEEGICIEPAHGGFGVFRYHSHGIIDDAFVFGDREAIFSIENLLGEIASLPTYYEALAAAVRIAGRGESK